MQQSLVAMAQDGRTPDGGEVAGTVESVALGVINPCGAAGMAGSGIRFVNGVQAIGNASSIADHLKEGKLGAAAA